MAQHFDSKYSTGINGLDYILRGILAGDNIVFQIESIEEYRHFASSFCEHAHTAGHELYYIRFADHEPLIPDEYPAHVFQLDPSKGFEVFIEDVHQIIARNGRGGYYVFDCLSELVDHWYSDQMLGNFFMLTCPYLFDVESIAYFGLYRNRHSFHATMPIFNTTQIFIEAYSYDNQNYVQPLKVQHRYSPTMYMLHVWKDQEFPIVENSATISQVLNSVPRSQISAPNYELGVWNQNLITAEEILKGHLGVNSETEKELLEVLIKMALSRDSRMAALLKKYLRLSDILNIGKRIVGTGLIGGKAVGMLLARAILEKTDPQWKNTLEPHDSFYIGSDVFYTFLVENGIWWERQRQKDKEEFLEGSVRARHRVLLGTFPQYIENQLSDLLDYFGQSPFIVRSSSLLEDNYGNAFAGKYESIFCVNQGPRVKRYEDLKTAIKTIYASAMSEKALKYRAQRGLLDQDEQMALLIQRVSGSYYKTMLMPHAAGVGFSLNPYVWNEHIDPAAGVLRLVFGLGTRAVDRRDDDYTRVISLSAPEKRPEVSIGEVRQYSQKKVDVLDFEANQLSTFDFYELLDEVKNLPLDMLATRDRTITSAAAKNSNLAWMLTFDNLLTNTDFVPTMRKLLQTLHKAYDYPVDIEFTCNIFGRDSYKINLLQCRPLQIKMEEALLPSPPENLSPEQTILKTHGAVIGPSRAMEIHHFVYIIPAAYSKLNMRDRYSIARLLGQLLHQPKFALEKKIMLIGPGRWGTSSPELGVPVSFSEIDTASVICEMVEMHENLIPDVSLGTHLFSDLVEMDILYMALFPTQKENYINHTFFNDAPNQLEKYLPDAEKWSHVLKVIDPESTPPILYSNTLKQDALCYLL